MVAAALCLREDMVHGHIAEMEQDMLATAMTHLLANSYRLSWETLMAKTLMCEAWLWLLADATTLSDQAKPNRSVWAIRGNEGCLGLPSQHGLLTSDC